ncbi:MAG: glycosyltransferase family 4 protein [bacterium]|nr:glycosyltransferase family 4 protein [bacterium]
MRILFITRKHPPSVGGMQNLSYNLIQNLEEQGKKRDDQIDAIILRKSQWHLIWWLPFALVRGLIAARRSDIVHLGDPALALIGFWIKIFWRKKAVVTVHGLDVTFPFFLYQGYLKFFARKFDRYICISSYAKEEAEKKGLSPCVIIPVGVDRGKRKAQSAKRKADIIDFFKKYHLPRDKFYLLTVGRLVKRKGAAWFIENAMPALPIEMIYLVVGDGAERENIYNLIKEQKLQDRVYLLGKITEEELKTVYALSDLFIMPNIKVEGDAEGFGLVAVEAALNSLPVIAARLEGICDAIAHNQNGILAESENAASFEREILKFFRDDQYRQRFGREAAAFTTANYNWSNIAERYYQEFLNVLL